jgi:hypothetical protein
LSNWQIFSKSLSLGRSAIKKPREIPRASISLAQGEM